MAKAKNAKAASGKVANAVSVEDVLRELDAFSPEDLLYFAMDIYLMGLNEACFLTCEKVKLDTTAETPAIPAFDESEVEDTEEGISDRMPAVESSATGISENVGLSPESVVPDLEERVFEQGEPPAAEMIEAGSFAPSYELDEPPAFSDAEIGLLENLKGIETAEEIDYIAVDNDNLKLLDELKSIYQDAQDKLEHKEQSESYGVTDSPEKQPGEMTGKRDEKSIEKDDSPFREAKPSVVPPEKKDGKFSSIMESRRFEVKRRIPGMKDNLETGRLETQDSGGNSDDTDKAPDTGLLAKGKQAKTTRQEDSPEIHQKDKPKETPSFQEPSETPVPSADDTDSPDMEAKDESTFESGMEEIHKTDLSDIQKLIKLVSPLEEEVREIPPEVLLDRLYAMEEDEPVLLEDMRGRLYDDEEDEEVEIPLNDLRKRFFAREDIDEVQESTAEPVVLGEIDNFLEELYGGSNLFAGGKQQESDISASTGAIPSAFAEKHDMGLSVEEEQERKMSADESVRAEHEVPSANIVPETTEEPVEESRDFYKDVSSEPLPDYYEELKEESDEEHEEETAEDMHESVEDEVTGSLTGGDTEVEKESEIWDPEPSKLQPEQSDEPAPAAMTHSPDTSDTPRQVFRRHEEDVPEYIAMSWERPVEDTPPAAVETETPVNTASTLSVDDWLDIMSGRQVAPEKLAPVPEKSKEGAVPGSTDESATVESGMVTGEVAGGESSSDSPVQEGPQLRKGVDYKEHHYVPGRVEPRKEEKTEPAREGLKKRDYFDQTKLKYKKNFSSGAKNPARICSMCAGREKADRCVGCTSDNARFMARLCDKCAGDKKTALNCVSCGRPNSRRIAKLCDRCAPRYRRNCYKCGAKL